MQNEALYRRERGKCFSNQAFYGRENRKTLGKRALYEWEKEVSLRNQAPYRGRGNNEVSGRTLCFESKSEGVRFASSLCVAHVAKYR